MVSGTVAARVAKGLFDYAVGRGVSAQLLREAAGIAAEELEDPELRIPFETYVRLMRSAVRLSGDPAFALHFGEAVDVREMSLAAVLGQSLETAMDVLAAVNRYARLDIDIETEGADRLALAGRRGLLWLVDMRSRPNLFPELTESVFARMVSAARRAGLQLPLREVHVTHREPGHSAVYGRIFGVPVRFGSDWNAIALETGAMAQRISLQPAYAGRIIEERAEMLLRDLQAAGSFRQAVEGAVRELMTRNAAGAAAVAGKLGVSRQTLYRRLRREGASFEQVLEAERKRLAKEYLSEGCLSLQEIAWKLGFADASSFSRAHKRWTGASPGGRRGERNTGHRC